MNVYQQVMLALTATLAAPFHAWAQCSLSLSPANIDLGQFNRTTLQASAGELPLPMRRLTLSLACETEQDLAISYHNALRSARGFDLSAKGRYRLSVHDGIVDEQAVQWAQIIGGARSTSRVASVGQLDGDYPLQPIRAGQVVRGKHLTAQVELSAALDLGVLGTRDAQSWLTTGSLEIAGQQREVNIRVGFAPAACRPTLSGGGRIDFGRIAQGALQRNAVTSFSQQTTLDVACDAETRFAIRAVDNRPESVSRQVGAPSNALFGIGRTDRGKALGGFTVGLGTAVGRDGSSASVLLGDPSAQVWQQDHQGLLRHDGQLIAFQRAAAPCHAPGAWSGVAIPLNIDLHLAPAHGLDLHQETAIDGSATLEIIYL